MKAALALMLVCALTLAACAPVPSRTGADNALAGAGVAAMDSRHDIVLAVANPVRPPPPHAGSNLLGYAAPTGAYRKGQRAQSTLAAVKQRYHLQEIVGWPIAPLGLYCVVLRPAPGTDREALLEKLAKDDRVRLAQPLHRYAVFSRPRADRDGREGGRPDAATYAEARYNDPYVGLQTGFLKMQVGLAQRASQGQGVDIALVDTGVDVDHPDLQGRIRATHNMVDDDAAAFNDDRHGTEVAGIIAALANNHQGIVGVAPKARLSLYKACWYPRGRRGARCNTFTLAKALAAIIATDIPIINLSLGGPHDPLLARLLGVLLAQGRTVVAAMPPDGHLNGFPAAKPGVIVVASLAAVDVPAGVLRAPGSDILTTQPNGRYDFTSGSSMAAAQVSGVAALLLGVTPGLDAAAVQRILQRSGDPAGVQWRVNAAAAVAAAAAMPEVGLVQAHVP